MIIDQDFAGLRLQGGRPYQQDYYAFCPVENSGDNALGSLLLVVADGAGGMADGEKASQAAVEGFIDAFFASGQQGSPRLRDALRAANQRLGEVCGTFGVAWDQAGTASTLVAVHAAAGWFEWISVGDSLLLRVRDGILDRQNVDHSMRQKNPGGPARSALVSALTGGPIPLVDEGQLSWQGGDWLLAGSDGLLSVPEPQLANIFSTSAGSARVCVKDLAALVHQQAKPDQDNTTIAILRHPSGIRSH